MQLQVAGRRLSSAEGQPGGSLGREWAERFLLGEAPALVLTCPTWAGMCGSGPGASFLASGLQQGPSGSEGLKTSSLSSSGCGLQLGSGRSYHLRTHCGRGVGAYPLSSCLGLFSEIRASFLYVRTSEG